MLIRQVHVRTSSLTKEVYNSQAFIPHAVLLCQAFAHCRKFPTAASRRSLDRVSVPVWLIVLSNQLLIVALVSHYLTNQLIRRELFFRRIAPLTFQHMGHQESFPIVIPLLKVNSHVLLTRPPLKLKQFAYDLHVLSIPPAFILSQDQTLHSFLNQNINFSSLFFNSLAAWQSSTRRSTLVAKFNARRTYAFSHCIDRQSTWKPRHSAIAEADGI